MNRPIVTLFMLQSVDGKISTGATDNFDVDKDIPNISGDPSKGLHQYYEEEQETDLFCLNSGRVMAKIGMNQKDDSDIRSQTPVTFCVIDNEHLKESGCTYLAKKHKRLVIITSNKNHPAIRASRNQSNIHFIFYSGKIKLKWVLEQLYKEYGCETLTLQTGSTLNGLFLREHLIDKINIVVTPLLIGGANTVSLIGGEDTKTLSDIGVLKLNRIRTLNNSYIQMLYDVVNSKTESIEYNTLM